MMMDMSRSTLSPSPTVPSTDALVIRPVYPDDAAALERLARLDSRRPRAGLVLLAERDGRILAALSADGQAVADPFARTADLVALLRLHAADTARGGRRQELLRRAGASPRKRLALARG
jgi:hypothetical protein